MDGGGNGGTLSRGCKRPSWCADLACGPGGRRGRQLVMGSAGVALARPSAVRGSAKAGSGRCGEREVPEARSAHSARQDRLRLAQSAVTSARSTRTPAHGARSAPLKS